MIIGKGKKILRINHTADIRHNADSILGVWIINHTFEAVKSIKEIAIKGEFELDIWYSYDNKTKTDILRSIVNYQDHVKIREFVEGKLKEAPNCTATILHYPTCERLDLNTEGRGIYAEVVMEISAEVSD